jgi:uncharacterized protein DUF6815
MGRGRPARVGLLYRREWDATHDPAASKLHGVFAAFAELGAEAEPVVYSDDAVERVRAQLLELDGVLVWVNPVQDGLDRSLLDPLLRDVADAGVFVSAHPDVILRMGTKQVLADTQTMAWGMPTRVYRSIGELRAGLRESGAAVVLKQYRGMGGYGVWKIELVDGETVDVQDAGHGAPVERMPLDALLSLVAPYLEGDGRLVQQPYLDTLTEGMTRAYCSLDEVVGFALQYPRGLLSPSIDPVSLPASKAFETADTPAYADLRERMESEWIPELQRILRLQREQLPVIWDADFLRAPNGDYVLCEINCSSTFAFPEHAYAAVARSALAGVSGVGARRAVRG